MRPVMPGSVGHYCERSGATVVGCTVRWPSEFSPRGLMPMRHRMERLAPLQLPVPRKATLPAPRKAPVSSFTLFSTSSEQPFC